MTTLGFQWSLLYWFITELWLSRHGGSHLFLNTRDRILLIWLCLPWFSNRNIAFAAGFLTPTLCLFNVVWQRSVTRTSRLYNRGQPGRWRCGTSCWLWWLPGDWLISGASPASWEYLTVTGGSANRLTYFTPFPMTPGTYIIEHIKILDYTETDYVVILTKFSSLTALPGSCYPLAISGASNNNFTKMTWLFQCRCRMWESN